MSHSCFYESRSYKIAAIVAAALLTGGVAEQSLAASCGPGAHWVDGCSAGTDMLAMSGSLSVNFGVFGVFTIPVVGTGGVLTRSAPVDMPDSLDPGHVNQINTEFVSGVLQNAVPLPGIGNISVRIGSGAGVGTASLGGIVETTDPSLAATYFDVYFQVSSALGVFHNNDPLRVTATTDSWMPDGGISYGLDLSGGQVGVYNDTNQLMGYVVDPTGTGGFHIAAVPIPPALYLFATGLLGLLRFARRKSGSLGQNL